MEDLFFDMSARECLLQALAGSEYEEGTMTVKKRNGCFGTWPFAGTQETAGTAYWAKTLNMTEEEIGDTSLDTVNAGQFILEEIGTANIAFLKIDTEGNEFSVMDGLIPLFAARRVAYMVIELNRIMWWRREFGKDPNSVPNDPLISPKHNEKAMRMYDMLIENDYQWFGFRGSESSDPRQAFSDLIHEPVRGHWLAFDFRFKLKEY